MRFTGGFENVISRIPGVSRFTLIVLVCVIVHSKSDLTVRQEGVFVGRPEPAEATPGSWSGRRARRYEGSEENGSVTVSVKVWPGAAELGVPAVAPAAAGH
jgi:hypothetical protein